MVRSLGGQVYVSFSGGKDSAVLLNLVRKIYPDVPAVFVDTGLEFPEIREFVKTFDNVIWLKPKMNFVDVIKKYGYPLISKEVSGHVHNARYNPSGCGAKLLYGTYCRPNGEVSNFCIPQWRFMLDADFEVHETCCDIMKKKPFHKYEKESGRKAITGTLATESIRRKRAWLKLGCNAFSGRKAPQSTPLAFWTEQDILQYIKQNDLPIAKPYGEIIETKKGLACSGMNRTGCIFCGFGAHLEKRPNRFETMAVNNSKLWDYCMRGGKYDERGMWIPDKGLGMAKVLDYINVQWWNDGDEDKRDEYRRIYHEKEEEQKKLKEQEQKEE